MYAKSILAILAAIAALGLVTSLVQASPSAALADLGTTAEKSLSQASYQICKGTETESYCRMVEDVEDDEDEPSLLEGLMTDDSDDE